MADQTRNLNAHKAATFARIFWGKQYSAQRGGTMDYWDRLSDPERQFCRNAVKSILASRDERKGEPNG